LGIGLGIEAIGIEIPALGIILEPQGGKWNAQFTGPIIFADVSLAEPFIVPVLIEIGPFTSPVGYDRFPHNAQGIDTKNKSIGAVIVRIENESDIVIAIGSKIPFEGRNDELTPIRMANRGDVKIVLVVGHINLRLNGISDTIGWKKLPEIIGALPFFPKGFIGLAIDNWPFRGKSNHHGGSFFHSASEKLGAEGVGIEKKKRKN